MINRTVTSGEMGGDLKGMKAGEVRDFAIRFTTAPS